MPKNEVNKSNQDQLRAMVGIAGLFDGLLTPNVVRAVDDSENVTIKTANSIVRLPHCVNRFSGFCIAQHFTSSSSSRCQNIPINLFQD